SKAQIDGFFALSRHGGLVDEDEVYRRAGYGYAVTGHKSWARRATHGAHVMDLACGLAPSQVLAHSPRIIGVPLPNSGTSDPSGTHLAAFVFSALYYILTRGHLLELQYGTPRLPVVVNLSYGRNQGPHDGTSDFETAIDLATVALRTIGRRFTMVLPAGNSHLTQGHAHFGLDQGPTRPETLEWRALPDDATSSILEVWLPAGAGATQVKVQVQMPDGTVFPPTQTSTNFPPSSSVPLLEMAYPGLLPGSGRIPIVFTMLPTTILDPTKPIGPTGIWRITLENVGTTPLWIDCWIARDDTPFGYPIRGRQSRFEDALYEDKRFDSQGRLSEVDVGSAYTKRDASMNGLATGNHAAVIGGCRRSDLFPARYSAGGPTISPTLTPPPPPPPLRTGPDATAFAEWSVACHGMLAAGTRGRTIVAVNGTSVSA